MRLPLVVGVLGLALAGCAAEPETPAPAALGEAVQVEVTVTTGAVRGVVVDDAIRPLAGVHLGLAPGTRSADTAPDGTFSFSGLEPGTYFVSAVRPGYSAAQQSVEVVAADEHPPVLKVQLARDATPGAYAVAQQVTGFILCTTSVVATCGAPNVVSNVLLCPAFDVCLGNVTDDRFGFDLFYEPDATLIQSEIVWASTQPLSPQLALQMETIAGCPEGQDKYYEKVKGGSPIVNSANATEVQAGAVGGTCAIFHSLFSGDTLGTPLGVTFQQRFDVYSTEFHGYLPPEGWTFTGEGSIPQPPE